EAGLPAPGRVVWRDSPRAGAIAVAELAASGLTGASVRGPIRTRPWATARDALTTRLGASGWARHWAAASARTWQLLPDRLVTPLRTRLAADLDSHGLTPARQALLDAVYGQHDAAWLGAFEGSSGLSGLAEVARSAGWWWPYEGVVVLTERPVAVHRDNLG